MQGHLLEESDYRRHASGRAFKSELLQICTLLAACMRITAFSCRVLELWQTCMRGRLWTAKTSYCLSSSNLNDRAAHTSSSDCAIRACAA